MKQTSSLGHAHASSNPNLTTNIWSTKTYSHCVRQYGKLHALSTLLPLSTKQISRPEKYKQKPKTTKSEIYCGATLWSIVFLCLLRYFLELYDYKKVKNLGSWGFLWYNNKKKPYHWGIVSSNKLVRGVACSLSHVLCSDSLEPL